MADALEIGYRHIDTALAHENERHVGFAIQETDVDRDQIFLTSKILPTRKFSAELDPHSVEWAVEEPLDRLDTDYLDLLLLQWPGPKTPTEATLEAMASLRERGWIKNIGVSNFTEELLKQALKYAPTFCNQIEHHVFLSQGPTLDLTRDQDVLVTVHTPLARGLVVNDPVLCGIAERHGKSAAQVGLRWLMDQDHVAIVPMAPTHEWRVQNWETFDFSLTDEDRELIAALAKDRRIVKSVRNSRGRV